MPLAFNLIRTTALCALVASTSVASAAAQEASQPPTEARLTVKAGPLGAVHRAARARKVRRVGPPVTDDTVADQTASLPKLPTPPAETKVPVAAVVQSDAQKYCLNIASAAADARFAWQAKKLADLEGQIRQRVADLEAKQAEYKSWLAKREEALKAAEKSLVGIYAKMRPEAASSQLSALDDKTAAAVLAQLNARAASAILNEMDTKRAVRLANTLAGNTPPPIEPEKKKP